MGWEKLTDKVIRISHMWQWSMQFCGLEGEIDACQNLWPHDAQFIISVLILPPCGHMPYNQLWILLYIRECNFNLWEADPRRVTQWRVSVNWQDTKEEESLLVCFWPFHEVNWMSDWPYQWTLAPNLLTASIYSSKVNGRSWSQTECYGWSSQLPASSDIRQQARPDVSSSEELQTHLNET